MQNKFLEQVTAADFSVTVGVNFRLIYCAEALSVANYMYLEVRGVQDTDM